MATAIKEREVAWLLLDMPPDNPADDLTPAERRALFYVARLCIGDRRRIAGVRVKRVGNRAYTVDGKERIGQRIADLQAGVAREIVQRARLAVDTKAA